MSLHLLPIFVKGAQCLSGRVLNSRPRGRGFEPYRRHCIVSLSKNINPSLVLLQPRKTPPFITERLLMGRKESNQTNPIFVHASSECSVKTAHMPKLTRAFAVYLCSKYQNLKLAFFLILYVTK